MSDNLFRFLTILRAGEGVDDLAGEIVRRFRQQQVAVSQVAISQATMSKDKLLQQVPGSLSKVRSAELRRRARDAKRLSEATAGAAEKSPHL